MPRASNWSACSLAAFSSAEEEPPRRAEFPVRGALSGLELRFAGSALPEDSDRVAVPSAGALVVFIFPMSVHFLSLTFSCCQ